MTDPFLEDCGGWTPAPDVLTRNKNYGFEGAYLWGRIRRLCQIGKGSYTISHEELGNRIGMSRRTVIKYLDRLIKDGYVEDLTPGVRNKAHTYSVKKGEDKILSGVQISHTEDDIPIETPNPDASESDVGMRNLHSDDAEIAHPDDEGMQDLPSRYAKNAHQGMQNLHLNRESLETLKETEDSSPYGEGGKPPPPIQEIENPAKHPAIQAYRSVANRYPDKATWDMIATAVGRDPPDIAFWTNVVRDYIACGWNKINVKTMLEHYKRRELPTQKASTNGTHQRSSTRPTGESLKGERTIDINTREYVYPDGHREPVPKVS